MLDRLGFGWGMDATAWALIPTVMLGTDPETGMPWLEVRFLKWVFAIETFPA